MDYMVYEHIIGLPAYLDAEMKELECVLEDSKFTADEAVKFIKQWVPDTDKYGRKRRVYIYRLTEKQGQNNNKRGKEI